MQATIVLLAVVCSVAVAIPLVAPPQGNDATAPNVPALQSIIVEAESEAEAVRKARQILDVNVDILSGGYGRHILIYDA